LPLAILIRLHGLQAVILVNRFVHAVYYGTDLGSKSTHGSSLRFGKIVSNASDSPLATRTYKNQPQRKEHREDQFLFFAFSVFRSLCPLYLWGYDWPASALSIAISRP
jgi:hypothetical protein